ncbi:hypothetical protein BZA77DRAFT_296478 [Pyronema omphalodes]|nr:hypothetical protein BZA77DRAFT_296478 [Pyronema omphalodes]
MWLRDFLRFDFRNMRVHTWGYHSNMMDDRSTTSITSISRKFLEDVNLIRQNQVISQKIIDLQFLIQSKNYNVHPWGVGYTEGEFSLDLNIFLSSKKILKFATEIHYLLRFERSGLPIRMVPLESAICSISEEHNKIGIHADHSKMIKFESRSDENYQRVISKIQDITKAYEKRRAQERLQGESVKINECATD